MKPDRKNLARNSFEAQFTRVQFRGFVRQIAGGYFEDKSGHTWLFNLQQGGWIQVSTGRALAQFKCDELRKRYGKPFKR